MKRARNGDCVSVKWSARDGSRTVVYERSFLAKYSEFFEGYFRTCTDDAIEVNLGYPMEIVKLLIAHLDGDTLSMTDRQEVQLKLILDYLLMREPYSAVDNVGYEHLWCSWCTSACDGSRCRAKRFIFVGNSKQCVLCCQAVQSCQCVHDNEHCPDSTWVYKFQRRSSII